MDTDSIKLEIDIEDEILTTLKSEIKVEDITITEFLEDPPLSGTGFQTGNKKKHIKHNLQQDSHSQEKERTSTTQQEYLTSYSNDTLQDVLKTINNLLKIVKCIEEKQNEESRKNDEKFNEVLKAINETKDLALQNQLKISTIIENCKGGSTKADCVQFQGADNNYTNEQSTILEDGQRRKEDYNNYSLDNIQPCGVGDGVIELQDGLHYITDNVQSLLADDTNHDMEFDIDHPCLAGDNNNESTKLKDVQFHEADNCNNHSTEFRDLQYHGDVDNHCSEFKDVHSGGGDNDNLSPQLKDVHPHGVEDNNNNSSKLKNVRSFRLRPLGVKLKDLRARRLHPPGAAELKDLRSHRVNNNFSDISKSDILDGETVTKKERPKRPCLYCRKFFSKLSDHIVTKHGHEDSVKHALSLPPKERRKEFSIFRKKAMFYHNINEMKKANPYLLSERASVLKNETVVCKSCYGTYGRRFFYLHRNKCNNSCGSINMNPLLDTSLISVHNFHRDILNKFRDRSSKSIQLCLKNELILKVGRDLYKKVEFYPEKKRIISKRIRSSMKYLAQVYDYFKSMGELQKLDLTIQDMFDINYFHLFEDSVRRVSQREGKVLISTRLHIRSVINQLINTMNYTYALEKNEHMLEEMIKFENLLKLRGNFLFNEDVFIEKDRKGNVLRKQSQLPDEKDFQKLRNFICTQLEKLAAKSPWTKGDYILARKLSICLLTFLNMTYTGDPCQLTMEEIEKVTNNNRVDERKPHDDDLSTVDNAQLINNHIVYQCDEDDEMRSVIIPKFLLPTMLVLSDKKNREIAGINPDSRYIFPSTSNSESYASRWLELYEVCEKAKVLGNMTSDKRRTRSSTASPSLNNSEGDSELLINHSKEMDSDPSTESTLIRLGKHLDKFLFTGNSKDQKDNGEFNVGSQSGEECSYKSQNVKEMNHSGPAEKITVSSYNSSKLTGIKGNNKRKRGHQHSPNKLGIMSNIERTRRHKHFPNKSAQNDVKNFLESNPSVLKTMKSSDGRRILRNKISNKANKLNAKSCS